MATKEIHKRKLSCYPRPKNHKMFKAYCDIHGQTVAFTLEQMIKFFFSQYSENEQNKLIKHFEEISRI